MNDKTIREEVVEALKAEGNDTGLNSKDVQSRVAKAMGARWSTLTDDERKVGTRARAVAIGRN